MPEISPETIEALGNIGERAFYVWVAYMVFARIMKYKTVKKMAEASDHSESI